MQIAILLYDNFTALDCIGPYEVLHNLPEAEVCFTAVEKGIVRADSRALGISADYSIDDVPSPDVLLIPGGPGDREACRNEVLTSWVAKVHETTTYTTSVCTGSLILAASGVLDGIDATTHWGARNELKGFGANPVTERVVERGKILTGAGVSAGIDMGLRLAARIAGEDFAKAIQLGIEYDPDPPFDSGSPEKCPPELVEMVRSVLGGDEPRA